MHRTADQTSRTQRVLRGLRGAAAVSFLVVIGTGLAGAVAPATASGSVAVAAHPAPAHSVSRAYSAWN